MKTLIISILLVFLAACGVEHQPNAPSFNDRACLIPADQGSGPGYGQDIEAPEQNTIECQQTLDRSVETSSLTSDEKEFYFRFLEYRENPESYQDTIRYLLEEVYGLEYLEPGFTYESSIAMTDQLYQIGWYVYQIMRSRPPYGDGISFPAPNYLTPELVEIIEEMADWVPLPLPEGTKIIETGEDGNLIRLQQPNTMITARQHIAEAVEEVCAREYLPQYPYMRPRWLLAFRDEMVTTVPLYFGDETAMREQDECHNCAGCHNAVSAARRTTEMVAGAVTGLVVFGVTGGPYAGGANVPLVMAADVAGSLAMDAINDEIFRPTSYCSQDSTDEIPNDGDDDMYDDPWTGGVWCDGFYCSPAMP